MTFNEWFESFRSEHPSDFDTESGADIIAMEWVAEKAWEACAENLGMKENQHVFSGLSRKVKEFIPLDKERETYVLMNTDNHSLIRDDDGIVTESITTIKEKVGDFYFCSMNGLKGEWAVPCDVVDRHFNIVME